jgi:hypothetical protein
VPGASWAHSEYYDADTFLPLLTESARGKERLSDYRDVKGVKLPFQITSYRTPMPRSGYLSMSTELPGRASPEITLTIRETQIDVPLSDDLFQKPDASKLK